METPAATPPEPYWSFLFGAWVASLPVVNALDHGMKSLVYGGSADGGATLLAMLAIAPAAAVAACRKRRTCGAAVVIGGACSPLAVVAMYLLWPATPIS